MKLPTVVNHPPRVDVPSDNRPLVAPIYQSVKFTFEDLDEADRHGRGEREGFFYSRIANPTLRQLELTLAALQGRDGCLLTSSGVAAVSLAMQALCKQGDHVIIFAEGYLPSRAMVRRVLARYGVRYTVLSIEDMAALEAKLRAEPTRLIIFESPTNPLLKIADIERITTLAKTHGALTLLDNTFAGFHNHGAYDIDVYVHSLTKYASGHGDVMGGAVIARKNLIASMRNDFIVMGATLDPHAAFLLQRGLKTYALRYERQCENALRVAQFFESSDRVMNVRYPGLPSHPQHQLARKQMRDFGSMVSFELKNGKALMKKFIAALQLFPVSASLGSTESLILPPQMQVPRDLNKTERAWSGITENTVRLSIGIEAVEDLIQDLERGLGACGQ